MTVQIILAEIFGTGILILLGDGVVANVLLTGTKGNETTGTAGHGNNSWIVITWAWAIAVFCGVTVAGPLSGAHLNPAVTLGLAVFHSAEQQRQHLLGHGPRLFSR